MALDLAVKERTVSSASGTFALKPSSDRNLEDRLTGKKVLVVLCDRDFQEGSQLLGDMVRHGFLPEGFAVWRWSDFMKNASGLSADIVVVNSLSPFELTSDSVDIAMSLADFRARNPKSALIMVSLYSSSSPPGRVLETLKEEKLVDMIAEGPIMYPALFENGLAKYEQKG